MSAGQHARYRTKSAIPQASRLSDRVPPPPAPKSERASHLPFEPCASTASYVLYAQRNVVLCLHHDTLALERKFQGHAADVHLIAADNISERGAGRLIASSDTTNRIIVWDLFTGEEIGRFDAYEQVNVLTWMRDGTVAFGNIHGNVILYEPPTQEHISQRTIYDPVTALAPASDCITFAIGYQNGSILIGTLQPSFNVIHTLTTSHGPSPLVGLAWHSSSSKQKTDMLAAQMADGDLRVFSVSRTPQSETPRTIRILKEMDSPQTRQNWFAWSKNGRIIQHSERETRACDVRTKKISAVSVPTIDHVVALSVHGPSGTLFTVGRNHSVQQYDLVSQDLPVMVANVQHVPPNAPPTPPDSIEESKRSRTVPMTVITSEQASIVPFASDAESSEEEGHFMSPLQKIAQEKDRIAEEEKRDHLAPLSPFSSRGSLSSASSGGRHRKQSTNPNGPAATSGSTHFSAEYSPRSGYQSPSVRSTSSTSSSRYMKSALRHEVMRSPEETRDTKSMDLFPYIKTRLTEVKFRAPTYGKLSLTPDVLRKEMLNVVFGWEGDIEELIREEQSSHRPGSASGVLLSKWLGDLGADAMAQMIGSESMTSSDWMLLALSCQMEQGSQKKVGEAFVKRLLETGEIHPAVAILLGLGEQDEAVEVYVSRRYYMEAVLLTCLIFPHDWQRQSHLVRKWGEVAVSQGQPELAVRCFSCTTIESSEPWFSPRAQDAIYHAQQQALAPDTLSPPISPPSATTSNRLTSKMASLRLVTTFGDQSLAERVRSNNLGATPIADTAMTPSSHGMWRGDQGISHRERSHSRTATPGGIGRRRFPSSSRNVDAESTPLAGSRAISRRHTPALSEDEAPTTAMELSHKRELGESEASSIKGQSSRTRNMSKERNHNGLQIDLIPTVEVADTHSPDVRPQTAGSTTSSRRTRDRDASGQSQSGSDVYQPNRLTGRNIDKYIDSLEAVSPFQQRYRTEERVASPSREARSRSRAHMAESYDPQNSTAPTHIKRSRRSPSSPVPMTADEAGRLPRREAIKDEHFRSDPSPAVTMEEVEHDLSRSTRSKMRNYSEVQSGSPEHRPRVHSATRSRQSSRNRSRHRSPGISHDLDHREDGKSHNSPKVARWAPACNSKTDINRSTTRHDTDVGNTDAGDTVTWNKSHHETVEVAKPVQSANPGPTNEKRTPRTMSRKELAARELEERRLSLARRPSVPNIVHPTELKPDRFRTSPRSSTDPGFLQGARPFEDILGIPRSHTAGPEVMTRSPPSVRFASPNMSTPNGLPATPKVMRQASPATPDGSSYVSVLSTDFATPEPVCYQNSPLAKSSMDDFGPLLPSSVFTPNKPPIVRSYSAPPINFPSASPNVRKALSANKSPGDSQNRASPRRDVTTTNRTHTRKGSEIDVIHEVSASFEAGMRESEGHDDQVIIIEESGAPGADQDIPMLPELAHLAGPPPPPPPPTLFRPLSPTRTSGIIDIIIDDNDNKSHAYDVQETSTDTNAVAAAAAAAPPPPPTHLPISSPPTNYTTATHSLHRRLSSTSNRPTTNDHLTSPTSPANSGSTGISSKWRTVTDRIRSSSRNRTISPPIPTQFELVNAFSPTGSPPLPPSLAAPYETIIAPPLTSQLRRASEIILAMSPSNDSMMVESTTPSSMPPPVGSTGYIRTPREIRANMPPGTWQADVTGTPANGAATPVVRRTSPPSFF